MAYVMNSEIVIGKYLLQNQVSSVKITTSRKQMTDTCTIQMGNLLNILDKEIKVGDAVNVRLGLDGQFNNEFAGYVSSITPRHPFTIECEDEMWQMKQQPIEPRSWETVTLKQLVQYIAPMATITAMHDIVLSPFVINKDVGSRFAALEQIRQDYGLDVYFRNKQLYIGLAYNDQTGFVNYHFQKNAQYQNLEFKRKEDVKIQVKAISLTANNQKREVTVGDKTGEMHTLHFFNKSESELKALALDKINLMKYDGYRGTFRGIGNTVAKHGMVARLFDSRYPQRQGSYFIDGVITYYDGSVGYMRDILLGRMYDTKLITQ